MKQALQPLPLDVFVAALRAASGAQADIPAASFPSLYRHYCELARWSGYAGLISSSTWERAVERHYADSLAALPLVSPGRLLDVGSGAGFPGLILAIAEPGLRVVLTEPRSKKAAFLRQTAAACGARAEVLEVRVETPLSDTLPAKLDFITLRAVRLDAKLCSGLGRRLAEDGRLLWWSGPSDADIPPDWEQEREIVSSGRERRIRVLKHTKR